jgi:hypothetical protein
MNDIVKNYINNLNSQNTFRTIYDYKIIPIGAEICISTLTRSGGAENDILSFQKTLETLTNRCVDIFLHTPQNNHLVLIITNKNKI